MSLNCYSWSFNIYQYVDEDGYYGRIYWKYDLYLYPKEFHKIFRLNEQDHPVNGYTHLRGLIKDDRLFSWIYQPFGAAMDSKVEFLGVNPNFHVTLWFYDYHTALRFHRDWLIDEPIMMNQIPQRNS